MLKKVFIAIAFFCLLVSFSWCYTRYQDDPEGGIYLGEFNGVKIYSDASIDYSTQISSNLDFQCVEYVRRYYHRIYNITLPNISTGCAYDIFDEYEGVGGLVQYINNSTTQIPRVGDIIVFDATSDNPYGHVAIISEVDLDLEIIRFAQQNWPGSPFGEVRFTINNRGIINISNYSGYQVLGFLSLLKSKPLKIIEKDCNPKQNSEINSGGKAWITFSNSLNPNVNLNQYFTIRSKQGSIYHLTRNDGDQNKTVIVVEGMPWISGDSVSITVKKGILDVNNNKLENDFILRFRIKKQLLISTGPLTYKPSPTPLPKFHYELVTADQLYTKKMPSSKLDKIFFHENETVGIHIKLYNLSRLSPPPWKVKFIAKHIKTGQKFYQTYTVNEKTNKTRVYVPFEICWLKPSKMELTIFINNKKIVTKYFFIK